LSSADVGQITFTGGEPLLANGIEELVLYCRMRRVRVSVISNGTVGDETMYRTLNDVGVSLFQFPIHASKPELHDYLTGLNGSWDRSVRSIMEVTRMKSDIVVVYVITALNHQEIEPIMALLQALGVKRLMLARFNVGGRGVKNVDELLPSVPDLNNVFWIANSKASAYGLTVSANVCLPFCIIDPMEYPSIRIASCSANHRNRPITVDYIGNVRMCNHSPTVMGNIFKHSFDSIFSSEYVQKWQQLPDECVGCQKASKCRGGCRAASEQVGGTLDAYDPYIELSKMSLM